MNFQAYNYVKSQIFNNFSKQELYVFYKFLLDMKPTELSIFDCLKQAKIYIEKEKTEFEKSKLKEMGIQKQKDYGDLLCL